MLRRFKGFSAVLLSAAFLYCSSAASHAKLMPLSAGVEVKDITPTPSPVPIQVYVPVIGSSGAEQNNSGVLDTIVSSGSFSCGTGNKFGAHLMISDGAYDVEIVSQLGMILEMAGECGFVKGFDPYMDSGSAEKWALFVAEARKRKLIPVLRIGYGKAPFLGDAEKYALHVAEINRKASSKYAGAVLEAAEIWNEPNLAESWDNNPDPAGYARFLHAVAVSLKSKSPSTKVMNGGLAFTDGDAHNIGTEDFISRMFSVVPELVNDIDIWSSHPYPQNFSGCSPYGFDGGNPKYCFNAYKVEIATLAPFYRKAGKALPPVLASETSWRSNQMFASGSGWWNDGRKFANYTPEEFIAAWRSYWLNDNALIGITPFQFASDHPRWREFNFVDPVTLEPNEYYRALQKLRKEVG